MRTGLVGQAGVDCAEAMSGIAASASVAKLKPVIFLYDMDRVPVESFRRTPATDVVSWLRLNGRMRGNSCTDSLMVD